MTYEQFITSLSDSEPPQGLSIPLQALWQDKKGNWSKGHDLVDSIHQADTNWVHAYFHRVEGDEWNAKYWYRRADKKFPQVSLEEEWDMLVRNFLAES